MSKDYECDHGQSGCYDEDDTEEMMLAKGVSAPDGVFPNGVYRSSLRRDT